MNKKIKSDNPILRRLIRSLRKKSKELSSDIWHDLADRLNRSNRSRPEVNISQLNRYTDEENTVVVPGKVLGSGKIDHPLSVAAFDFSNQAREIIQSAGGEVMGIEELLDRNPEGSNVSIVE